jgi:acetoin utilization deacetylase AcuC-like enzyme
LQLLQEFGLAWMVVASPSPSPLRFFHPDAPELPLPPGHRFPAGKYRMLREMVAREDILGAAALLPSPPAGRNDLLRAHATAYVDAVLSGSIAPDMQRRIGLPWSETLVARSRAAVGGSLAAARAALEDGLSGQLAGGTHHAHRDFGSGYCLFNDFAVTALTLLEERRVERVAIVDLDVHQGDGNAAILGGDGRAFVLSVHGERNFPFHKVPSDLDIALPDGTGDAAYLAVLGGGLDAVLGFRPDLILYLSGADPLATDTLGLLALTFEGLIERDRMVLDLARRHAIPISIAIGGGYASPISDSVRAYANTFRVAREVFHL